MTRINSCHTKENIKLEDYLKTIDIKVEHYSSSCKMFKVANMYLLINATSKSGIVTTYTIPIELDENC